MAPLARPATHFLAVPGLLLALATAGCIGDLNKLRGGDAGAEKPSPDVLDGPADGVTPSPFDGKPDTGDSSRDVPPDLVGQEVPRDGADDRPGDAPSDGLKLEDTGPDVGDPGSEPPPEPRRDGAPEPTDLPFGPEAGPEVGRDTADGPSDPAPPQDPVPGRCPALTSTERVSVSAPSLTAGAEASYACLTGYIAAGGNDKRVCQSDGTWSGTALTCNPVDCGPPPQPTNGSATAPATTFNAKATYSCAAGFALSGGTERTCQADRSWSGSTPTCSLVNCGDLANPTNGRVDVPSTTLNAVATYSCNSGFDRSGVETRTCQASGVWSGSAPTCSCPRSLCGSSCVDMQTNTSHCGACNTACAAASPSTAQCVAGRCLVTLAASQGKPHRIAVDGTSVYWTNSNSDTVMKIGLGGGATTTLATGQANPVGITVDAGYVYWTNMSSSGGGVNRVSVNGGTVTPIASGQDSPADVAVDAAGVYWSNTGGSREIMRGSADGAAVPSPLGSGYSTVVGIAVAGSYVYWASNASSGDIWRAPADGSVAANRLASGQPQPHDIVVSGTNVYWTNYSGGTIARAPVTANDATPDTLVPGLTSPRGLTTDGVHLYWTNFGSAGTIMRASMDGSGVTTLATTQNNPGHLVVDSTSVYWTDYGTNNSTSTDGSVMKLTPK